MYVASDMVGYPWADGSTKRCPIAGDGNWGTATSDLWAQAKIYENTTWAYAAIYIKTNSTTGASVLQSMKNSAPVNQTISIPAGQTGLKQDTVNTDALVANDLIHWTFAPGSAHLIEITFVSCTLDGTVLQIAFNDSTFLDEYFILIGGDAGDSTTESVIQYTARQSCTFSKLRIVIKTNTRNGQCELWFRKNAADGAQNAVIAASSTGAKEDAVNTDAVVGGDLINYRENRGGTTGSLTKAIVSMKNSANRIAFGGTSTGVFSTGTQYQSFEGWVASNNTSEPLAQVPIGGTMTMKNMWYKIEANAATVNSTLRTRKNTANGNMTYTLPGGATGIVEDLVNSDSLVATDLYNMSWTVGDNNITVRQLAVEEQATAAPPAGTPAKGGIASRVLAAVGAA